MEKSLEVYPELCEPMPVGGQEYVFLCERSVYYMKEDVHPFPEVPLIGDRDWVFVDPLTMGSTGTSRRLIVYSTSPHTVTIFLVRRSYGQGDRVAAAGFCCQASTETWLKVFELGYLVSQSKRER